MPENRFESIYNEIGLKDNQTGLDIGISPAYRFHVRDKLNEFAEENEQLKSFKANVKEVLKHEYEGYEDKVWGTWIKSLALRLRVDIND